MLVAMAGLPGTGKSTLAGRLATAVGGVVLSKDVVRAALFPPPVLDYSAAQDDAAMAAVYAAARLILAADPGRVAILDGRTFRTARQVADLVAAAGGHRLAVVECVCDDDVAERRVAADHAAGAHPAGNRTPELVRRVRATAEPLAVPRLVLDTGRLSVDECVSRCREYLLVPSPLEGEG